MKLKLHGVYAHPTRGTHQPGAVLCTVKHGIGAAEVKQLIDGGYASEHVIKEPAAAPAPELKPSETAAREIAAHRGAPETRKKA